MSNSTKDYSEADTNAVNIENPHANLELDENELAEIYARPYMNPDYARYGCDSHSNRILDAEKALVESKQEKCFELIKQNGDIFRILEQAKTDKYVLAMTGGREVDLTAIYDMLFSDQHFLNLLGDLLTKRPATKKVEAFFSTQV